MVALSILTSVLYAPLEKWAQHLKTSEEKLQSVIQPQLKEINTKLSGQEAWAATRRLYKRYRYHPFKSIRTAAFPILQLPLLFLAYYSLSSLDLLAGVSFGPINDLYIADNLLFGLALLPFLMTFINISTTFVGSFTNRERTQAIIIALLFLLLLYTAPAALLIYWTSNNLIGLAKALFKKLHQRKNRNNWVDRLKQAPAWVWTLPLCPLIPTLFLWANNVAYYPIKSVLASFLIIIIASAICYLLLYLIAEKIINQNQSVKSLSFCFYNLFCGFVICALGFSTIHGLFYGYRFYVLTCFPILLTLVVYLLGYRAVNYLFVAQISVSIILFCFNYGTDKQINLEVKETVSELPILKNKPNIYYFLCESYQNLDYVQDVFGYDSSGFLANLKQHGYTIYNNIYSNSYYTLGTLTNIFTMSANMSPASSSLSFDASSWERSVIGGGKGNRLLEILKYNGYETSIYFKGDNYFFKFKGDFLDHTDISFGVRDLLQPIEDTNSRMPQLLNIILPSYETNVEQDSLTILKNHFLKTKNSPKPQFFAHRLFKADHTSPTEYTYHTRDDFIESRFYQKGIKEGNTEIEAIMKTIEINDPNSIVIFLGGHGVWTLRGFPLNSPTGDLVLSLSKEGFTLNDFINDLFYVFAAIKLPEDVVPLKQFSPANIFSQLFDRLSDKQISVYNPDNICLKLSRLSNELICQTNINGNLEWSYSGQKNLR